ncbi:hypothetical protein ACUN0G_15645 [Pseudomonas sp. 32A]|jgi:hypothetical protein|uniref:hypothetical protein n=1 Tax=Pseudomonas TaxID=286 RepID=UPI003B9F9325
MTKQNHGKPLQSKTHHANTIVDWDEFRKIVNVGDTYEFEGVPKVVTKKVYEVTPAGDAFNIYVYID